MDTIAIGDRQRGWDAQPGEPGAGLGLSGRPRRRFLNRYSAALLALLAAAAGFYAGVRVEKSQSGTSTSGLSALASRFSAPSGASGTGARGASGAQAAGGFASRFGGAATVGTVASVNGKTLYVTESSGDVVRVQLSSTSTITKSESVSAAAVHPGDTVVIRGAKQANGSIVATSVTDSGSGGGLAGLFGGGGFGGAGAGSSSSSSSGSVGGELGSLFSSGG